jgi:glycosyltransferase involved in cell wall biosynthesis
MNIEVLFIHPNFPGQFHRLATRLAREPDIRMTALGDASWMVPNLELPGVRIISYPAPDAASAQTHTYARSLDAGVRRGQQTARTLMQLKLDGYEPDLIYVHPGWGDGLYLKEIFPATKVVGLFEFFYNTRGADVGFDPMFPMGLDDLFRVPLLNAIPLLALESCDLHLSPTQWQRSRYPDTYRERIQCLHEGVETDKIMPDPAASFTLPNGKVLRAGDEILTYVSRGFEPYRGFHVFMQALPQILAARPNCQVLMVGGDKNHYGPAPKDYATWKEKYLAELESPLDPERVHFTGPLGFESYLKVLQVSRAHVYLTYPFVLSWSMLEAMAAGCLVIGSDTEPVREVIAPGVNGLLVPFFDVDALVATINEALANPEEFLPLREAAVMTIKKRYDFEEIVFPEHMKLFQALKSQKELV